MISSFYKAFNGKSTVFRFRRFEAHLMSLASREARAVSEPSRYKILTAFFDIPGVEQRLRDATGVPGTPTHCVSRPLWDVLCSFLLDFPFKNI